MANKSVKAPKKGNKRFHIEMTSMGMFLFVFGLFFLLAWIFVLGILVGRGFLPGTVTAISDLKRQISRLQAVVNHKKTEERVTPEKSDSDPKLAFYEKLSSKKDEAKKKSGPELKPEGGGTPAAVKEDRVTGPPLTGAEAVADKPVSPFKVKEIRESLQDTRENQRDSDKTGEPGNEMRYTVQIASVADKEKAEGLIARLVKQGYPAYYYEVEVKGKTYYRIRCGRFIERPEAADYAKKLEKEAGIKGFVSRLE
ncbi:MAG: SPOR domain-containing protein [Pseudomonadota bacterium]